MAIIEAPLKQVMFLHMDTANEPLPDGFALCDGSTLTSTQQDINPGGTYTVPDLRNSFILCADATKVAGTAAVTATDPNINAAAGAPGPRGTGGAHNHTLSIGELPAHTHTATTTGSVSVTDPGHVHSVTDPGHSHTITDTGHTHTSSTSTVGDHNHGITDAGHSHNLIGGIGTGQISRNNGSGTGSAVSDDSQWNGGSLITAATTTTGISINNAGSHTHTVTVNSATTGISEASATTGVSVVSHTTGITASLSATTTNTNTGTGTVMDIRPRYYGLVAIIRVKA